ncbi:MAG: nucleotide pyrophosphohydrolase [Nitrospinaceae bacterium]|jgi:NTP pyrophosphatase (non-canonical NTP hydrolase)|nr:nucleotide pyrophosphohydrolase [Nitrospinaceae bacterium]|tara:strand:- start:284 stop:625 length:342 start_codon:yes stop_codon:yes gene_type:complete
MDDTTTVQDLKTAVDNFVDDRDWAQFHSPKNLSMALTVEASELMDLFKWKTTEEAQEEMKDQLLEDATDELADIMIYAIAFANRNEIDISIAVKRKIDKNIEKYPAEKFREGF